MEQRYRFRRCKRCKWMSDKITFALKQNSNTKELFKTYLWQMQYSNPIKIPRTNLIARARLVPPMLTQVMFLVLRSLKKNKLTKLRDTTHFDSEDDYRRGC